MATGKNRRLVLWIEYDGTEFHGWQIQPGQRTVQSEIESALARMCGEDIRIIASGRTDAGVHSLRQVAHFDTSTDLKPKKFRLGLNSLLEKDVSIIDSREAKEPFHAQFDAVRKTYRYRILTRKGPSALRRSQVWHHSKGLDLARMQEAAGHFVGERDFASFCPEKIGASSTIRKMDRLEVFEVGDEFWVEVTAGGFLRFMVRTIVGTLAEVGRGERSPDSMPEVLEARDRKRAGMRAPAHGLYLVEVEYGKKIPPPDGEDRSEPEGESDGKA